LRWSEECDANVALTVIFFAEMTGFKTKSLPLIKRQAVIVSSETGSVVIGFRQYLKRWRRGDVEAAVDVMTFTGHAT